MEVTATTDNPLATGADTIVVGLFDGEGVPHDVGERAIAALIESGEASTRLRRLAVLHAEGRRFVTVGLGARAGFDPQRARAAAAAAHGRAQELGARTLCWEVPHRVDDAILAGLVQGTMLHAYSFDRYRPGKAQADERPRVQRLVLSAHDDVSAPVREAATVAAAQNRARDLANTPSNDLPPSALADYAVRMAEEHDALTVTVLDEAAIRDAGMGAFAAVAQGSAQEARLIRIDYNPPDPVAAPRLGFVGKAVTFDSGGLSLKPAGSMHEMKFDMSGGAAVVEALGALAALALPVRVTGIVGATENMPSGTAVKPGDIVRAMDGTTIEINNTDAEGRLVLSDCLCYAREQGAERLIDLATLTGGIVVALGSVYTGLFANDDEWADAVAAAATRSGEAVWRMPLHPDYAKMIEGRYAQIINSTPKREATAVTAAEFLHHFSGGVPWAHLDIAGTAWDVSAPPFAHRGATGVGVRLLVELARSHARAA